VFPVPTSAPAVFPVPIDPPDWPDPAVPELPASPVDPEPLEQAFGRRPNDAVRTMATRYAARRRTKRFDE
jgi:hypothetical protein